MIMARYARIDAALTVTEWKEISDPSVISQHKKWSDGGLLVRPVEDSPVPTYRPELAKLDTVISVQPTKVVITHNIVPHGEEVQRLAVKAEANKRILERFPSWKQANMIAREGELLRTVLGQMLDANGSLMSARDLLDAEKEELKAINAGWAWIKAVRARSDEIEKLNPIPDDYDASKRWVV